MTVSATRAGSFIYGVGNDWDAAIARTPALGQTVLNQFLAPVGDTFWMQTPAAQTAAPGPVTLSDSAPITDQWNYAAVEIMPLP